MWITYILGEDVASRDIVQFVELRKFLSKGMAWDKEALAKEVLFEIPGTKFKILVVNIFCQTLFISSTVFRL